MKQSNLDKTTKLDIAASIGLGLCTVLFIASSELSIPLLAGVGAVGAAATGLARIGVEYINKH